MSAETDALRAYMRAAHVGHRVTSVIRDQPGSFHHVGQAVDFAGPTASWDTPQLLAVYQALLPLAAVAEELFYGGRGGALWKDGRRITHAGLIASHRDHVHVAVPKGWRWTPPAAPKEEPPVAGLHPDDPNAPNITGPIHYDFVMAEDGSVLGYYCWSSTTGELHAYGDVPFLGRSEVR